SGTLDVGVHYLFFTGNVEMDSELVVLDVGDRAVTEFLMEHAAAHGKPANPTDLLAAARNRAVLDQQRWPQRGRRRPKLCRRRHMSGRCPIVAPVGARL